MRNIQTKRDIGILIIRVCIGLSMLAFHGIPKISGGLPAWEKIGLAMGNIGINFLPTFWGFAAALTETLGSLFIILGLWTRPSALLLAFTMLIATITHLIQGDGFSVASHSFELLAIFVALFFTGPGKYSIDKK